MIGTETVIQASAVAIGGRALLIEGPPGCGKSTLALTLIDRGAQLIGDDGVALARRGDRIVASPPPRIAGMLEIRGVGIVELPAVSAPLTLAIMLGTGGPRLPDAAERRDILGLTIPCLTFPATAGALALRVEQALALHGLTVPEPPKP